LPRLVLLIFPTQISLNLSCAAFVVTFLAVFFCEMRLKNFILDRFLGCLETHSPLHQPFPARVLGIHAVIKQFNVSVPFNAVPKYLNQMPLFDARNSPCKRLDLPFEISDRLLALLRIHQLHPLLLLKISTKTLIKQRNIDILDLPYCFEYAATCCMKNLPADPLMKFTNNFRANSSDNAGWLHK
jgi:hypothetical protein